MDGGQAKMEAWSIVRVNKHGFLVKHLRQLLQSQGICDDIVPYIGWNTRRQHFDLVLCNSHHAKLVKVLDGDMSDSYDPTAATNDDLTTFDVNEAIARARADFLDNALGAMRVQRSVGPSTCYRAVAEAIGLLEYLDRLILYEDVLVPAVPFPSIAFAFNAKLLIRLSCLRPRSRFALCGMLFSYV